MIFYIGYSERAAEKALKRLQKMKEELIKTREECLKYANWPEPVSYGTITYHTSDTLSRPDIKRAKEILDDADVPPVVEDGVEYRVAWGKSPWKGRVNTNLEELKDTVKTQKLINKNLINRIEVLEENQELLFKLVREYDRRTTGEMEKMEQGKTSSDSEQDAETDAGPEEDRDARLRDTLQRMADYEPTR